MLRVLADNIRSSEGLLREFVERASREVPRCTIVLFGSRALSAHRPYSDFDIAVIVESIDDPLELVVRLRRLRPGGLPLDLTVLNIDDLEDPIVARMLRGCKVLHDGLGLAGRLEGLGCTPHVAASQG